MKGVRGKQQQREDKKESKGKRRKDKRESKNTKKQRPSKENNLVNCCERKSDKVRKWKREERTGREKLTLIQESLGPRQK
jgi:hypothetical protein